MILSDDSRSWETIHKSHLLSSQILTAAPHHELGRRFTSLSASPAYSANFVINLLRKWIKSENICVVGSIAYYISAPSSVSSAQAIIKLIKWIQRRRGLKSEEADGSFSVRQAYGSLIKPRLCGLDSLWKRNWTAPFRSV
ncbi:hypothetical protein F8388_002130 [Cannabis sativa]|uniref:Uncharacterized protein n=1 Tax=Cannabis sativa TaxID=3483 RepID=A0A7J6F0Y9_CANSA|nr:hypothetical protein F8388_002130 [Cannabis sativa]